MLRLPVVVALLLAVLLATGCAKRTDDAALEKTATEAMADLNKADDAFPSKITEALTKLGGKLLLGTASAAETIETTIVPLVDEYLAKIDRAATTADAYLATRTDAPSKAALEIIRKRAEAFRKARARFGEMAAKARAGATSEELNAALFQIGLLMSVDK